MQEVKNTEKAVEQQQVEPEEEDIKGKRKPNTLKSVLEGSILTSKSASSMIPFIIYLGCISLFYIFNANYSVRIIIETSKIKKQNEELRFEYVNTKAKLMQKTRQMELAKRLEKRGIYEAKTPARKIVVEDL